MSRDPIIGSGRKGFGFEKKGIQERNLLLLLETLSKKETQKAVEALSKIKKDEWIAMAATATMLNSFVTLGGNVAFFNVMTESIKETIKLQVDSLLSPLTNEINQQITDLLTPFINDVLGPVINQLTTFIATNTVGAGIGGIAGAVASLFIPGGPILIAIGAVIGAAVEEAIRDPAFEGDVRIEEFLSNRDEFSFFGIDRIEDFLEWIGKIPTGTGGRKGGFQDAF